MTKTILVAAAVALTAGATATALGAAAVPAAPAAPAVAPPGGAPGTWRAISIRQATNGRTIYRENCKDCHGSFGAPTKESLRKYEKIADFTKRETLAGKTDKELIEAVTNGKGRDMKGFKDKLSAAEIDAAVQYVKTLVKK
ncbi:MAG: cytochrome c [Gemmatimonadota bacterium]|nr:cytochrome c [Gemmatimonadota bacterium]